MLLLLLAAPLLLYGCSFETMPLLVDSSVADNVMIGPSPNESVVAYVILLVKCIRCHCGWIWDGFDGSFLRNGSPLQKG